MLNTVWYVVFHGWKPGVYESWEECQSQIMDYDEPKFRKYDNLAEAKQAFRQGLPAFYRKRNQPVRLEEGSLGSITKMIMNQASQIQVPANPVHTALCVHVRGDKKTGNGIYVYDWANAVNQKDMFRFTQKCPETRITRNLAEFDALVKGLAILKKYEHQCPIYTESDVAKAWIASGKGIFGVKGVDQLYLEGNEALYNVINGKFRWLFHAKKHNQVLKWHRQHWGESPAEKLLWHVDEEDVVWNADDGAWTD